ncbi:hypothetical protein [Gordonia sp. DT101]|uniref:hypothetical protein n=1 Tax=Gordonia sp. DT101 TaxID=3416545 RepID=UPI003CEBF923
MAVTLTTSDIAPFVGEMTSDEQDALEIMVVDVTAAAVAVAPCLAEPALPENLAAAAKAHMRGAVLRWYEANSGAVQTQSAGPFSETIDTSVRRGGLLWPSEIKLLQDICATHRGVRPGAAFAIDTVSPSPLIHADSCDVYFSTTRGCSCGAALTAHAALWGT